MRRSAVLIFSPPSSGARVASPIAERRTLIKVARKGSVFFHLRVPWRPVGVDAARAQSRLPRL
jgi:hypothetical protein